MGRVNTDGVRFLGRCVRCRVQVKMRNPILKYNKRMVPLLQSVCRKRVLTGTRKGEVCRAPVNRFIKKNLASMWWARRKTKTVDDVEVTDDEGVSSSDDSGNDDDEPAPAEVKT